MTALIMRQLNRCKINKKSKKPLKRKKKYKIIDLKIKAGTNQNQFLLSHPIQ